MQITELSRDLAKHEQAGEYLAVIEGCATRWAPTLGVQDPWIKGWVGRRWRDLFMQEAVKDGDAVEYASKPPLLAPVPLPGSSRTQSAPRHRRTLPQGCPASEWQAEMPAAQYKSIDNTTLILCGGLPRACCTPRRTLSGGGRAALSGARLAHPAGRRASHAVVRGQRSRYRGGLPRPRAQRTDEAHRRAEPTGQGVHAGYSKGTPDILSFLLHHPEYRDQIKGVFTWGGAVGGSYTADGVYDQIKNLPTEGSFEYISTLLAVITGTMLSKAGLRRLDEYDIRGAMNDLHLGPGAVQCRARRVLRQPGIRSSR